MKEDIEGTWGREGRGRPANEVASLAAVHRSAGGDGHCDQHGGPDSLTHPRRHAAPPAPPLRRGSSFASFIPATRPVRPKDAAEG